jgi:hypothetical protein
LNAKETFKHSTHETYIFSEIARLLKCDQRTKFAYHFQSELSLPNLCVLDPHMEDFVFGEEDQKSFATGN